MRLEYIRIKRPELLYGKKELLNYELSFLLMVKKFEELRKIRRQRTALKKDLRVKISQAVKALSNIEKNLPRVAKEKEKKEDLKENKSKPSLEQEIEEVKSKLGSLQNID